MAITKQEAELRQKIDTFTGAISVVSPSRALVGPYTIELVAHQRGRIRVEHQVGSKLRQEELLTRWIPDGWERISNEIISAYLPKTEEIEPELEVVGAS